VTTRSRTKLKYFAVATEGVLRATRALSRELPEVYAELRGFYGLDLAARISDPNKAHSRAVVLAWIGRHAILFKVINEELS